jgi:hypothetical protein
MDERTLEPSRNFDQLTDDLTDCFADVMMEVGGDLVPRRIAAD